MVAEEQGEPCERLVARLLGHDLPVALAPPLPGAACAVPVRIRCRAAGVSVCCNHRDLLARQKYFDALLNRGFRESQCSGEQTEISFELVEPLVLAAILAIGHGLPLSELSDTVLEEAFELLVEAAAYISADDALSALSVAVQNLPGSRLCPALSSCLDLGPATSGVCESLLDAVVANFDEICDDSENSGLVHLDEHTFLDLIARDDLSVRNEEAVLGAALDWLRANASEDLTTHGRRIRKAFDAIRWSLLGSFDSFLDCAERAVILEELKSSCISWRGRGRIRAHPLMKELNLSSIPKQEPISSICTSTITKILAEPLVRLCNLGYPVNIHLGRFLAPRIGDSDGSVKPFPHVIRLNIPFGVRWSSSLSALNLQELHCHIGSMNVIAFLEVYARSGRRALCKLTVIDSPPLSSSAPATAPSTATGSWSRSLPSLRSLRLLPLPTRLRLPIHARVPPSMAMMELHAYLNECSLPRLQILDLRAVGGVEIDLEADHGLSGVTKSGDSSIYLRSSRLHHIPSGSVSSHLLTPILTNLALRAVDPSKLLLLLPNLASLCPNLVALDLRASILPHVTGARIAWPAILRILLLDSCRIRSFGGGDSGVAPGCDGDVGVLDGLAGLMHLEVLGLSDLVLDRPLPLFVRIMQQANENVTSNERPLLLPALSRVALGWGCRPGIVKALLTGRGLTAIKVGVGYSGNVLEEVLGAMRSSTASGAIPTKQQSAEGGVAISQNGISSVSLPAMQLDEASSLRGGDVGAEFPRACFLRELRLAFSGPSPLAVSALSLLHNLEVFEVKTPSDSRWLGDAILDQAPNTIRTWITYGDFTLASVERLLAQCPLMDHLGLAGLRSRGAVSGFGSPYSHSLRILELRDVPVFEDDAASSFINLFGSVLSLRFLSVDYTLRIPIPSLIQEHSDGDTLPQRYNRLEELQCHECNLGTETRVEKLGVPIVRLVTGLFERVRIHAS